MASTEAWKSAKNAFDALHQCCDEGKVDINTLPDARFRQNFAWFVDEHNDVRLPFGWYLENRRYEADLRTLLLNARISALESLRKACENEGQDPEWLIQAIKERASDGVIHFSSHDDELAMNAIFAHWFAADPEAHWLVRWLLEAEFLDAYVFNDNDETSALNEGKRYAVLNALRILRRPNRRFQTSCSFPFPVNGRLCRIPTKSTIWGQQAACSPIGFVVKCWEALPSMTFRLLMRQQQISNSWSTG